MADQKKAPFIKQEKQKDYKTKSPVSKVDKPSDKDKWKSDQKKNKK